MRTTIDKAGRIVIPKDLRDRLGITAGSTVEIHEDGSSLRLDLVASDLVIEVGGYLLIDGGAALSDKDLRELRLAQQR
jgi:AbrB family looped-hinge helix DNA binding protein